MSTFPCDNGFNIFSVFFQKCLPIRTSYCVAMGIFSTHKKVIRLHNPFHNKSSSLNWGGGVYYCVLYHHVFHETINNWIAYPAYWVGTTTHNDLHVP